jgi:hypothetical protein
MSTVRSIRALLAVSALAVCALAPATANATPAEADAVRISTSGQHTLKWTWTPPGKSDRYGHAEAIINAPIDGVRKQVQNFNQYKDFAPKRFTLSKVVPGTGGGTNVKMEFSVLKGLVKLNFVEKFAAPRAAGAGTEIIEGKFVSGNVKDANVVWTLEQVDDAFTVLKCDVLIKPDLPGDYAQSAIDEELRDAAQQAVDGVHLRAQGHGRFVQWSPNKG